MTNETRMNRRTALSLAVAASSLAALPAAAQDETQTSGKVPFRTPTLEFVYEAIAEVAEAVDLGRGPLGSRRMVPITGGTFEGPRLRGKVVPGGVDRQLVRSDDVRLLDAFYEMETDDGAVLTVRNHVVSIPEKPRFSYLEITAPEGPYGWMNDLVFVGTLDSLRPERAAVVIRVFAVA